MRWVCLAESVAGSAHESRGTGSNDAFSTAVFGDTAIIAVADGAGSAIQATAGATLAVQTAISHLSTTLAGVERLSATEVQAAVELARTSVIQHAEGFGLASADFACTLLLCVASAHEVIAAQIGDGAIVAIQANAYRLLCPVRRGEFLNETVFLTSDDALDHLVLTATSAAGPHDLRHIAVLSDGLQALALDLETDAPFSGFFNPLFAWAVRPDAEVATLTAFLQSFRVREKTDDDVTLALLVDQDADPPAVAEEAIGPSKQHRSRGQMGAPATEPESEAGGGWKRAVRLVRLLVLHPRFVARQAWRRLRRHGA